MPVCLKKLVKGSPPPFSSSFSLPLWLCLPYLVILIGLEGGEACGAVLCIFTVIIVISSDLVIDGILLRAA